MEKSDVESKLMYYHKHLVLDWIRRSDGAEDICYTVVAKGFKPKYFDINSIENFNELCLKLDEKFKYKLLIARTKEKLNISNYKVVFTSIIIKFKRYIITYLKELPLLVNSTDASQSSIE